MKKIFNLIFTICLICLVLIVYLNLDKIVDKTVEIFGENKEITLNEPNEYKRNYNLHLKKYNKEEDYIPYNKDDIVLIIYNVLNNGYDNFTFYCPKEYTSCKKDVENITNDKKLLSAISNYVSPYNSYKKLSSTVYVDGKIELKITKNYTAEEIEKINSEIEKIINKLDLENLNTKKKITKIHDYFVMKTKYDKVRSENGESEYSSNKAIGPLFEGYAICSGFSDVMSLFLDELGIPNIKVASDKHVWNLAYVDGKWLHIDLTWDLPLETTNENIHTFLLINSKELKALDTKEHIWDEKFYIEAN